MDDIVADSYPATYTYQSGRTANLKAVPSPGYRFVNWSGDLTTTSQSAAIEMTCNRKVTAIFAPITYILTVDASPSVGGEVIVEPPQPAEGYAVGTEVTLTAVDSQGYQFSHWSGAASGSENQTTIMMESGKKLIANFVELSSSSFAWWWIVVEVVVIGLLLYFLIVRKPASRE